MKKSKRFRIEELVCKDVFNRDGEKAWRYFRPELIDFLDWFRGEIESPVYINNWLWGGNKTQRGFRCNLCPLVATKKRLYVSPHMIGAGVDLNVKGMTPDEVRAWIVSNINRFFNLHPEHIRKCRLEKSAKAPTWVHVDFYEHDKNWVVYEF